MNAALAFLNGIGRDRPAASDTADDVWMMNILLASRSAPPRPAIRRARRHGRILPQDAEKGPHGR
ncbi:MAG: hypothetical protein ACYDBZ_17795 [Steroidobacteraceae bacterium]